MAEPRGGGARQNMAEAGFVGQIVKDPKNPPKTLLLVGYLGRSSEEGHTRLYLDPELSDYVEIPNEAILHTEPAGDDAPLNGNYVWINRSAEVVHGEAGSTRYRASFLEGRITQDYLSQAGGGAAQAAALPTTIPYQLCNPTQFPPFCPPSIPLWRCPTRVYPLCPRSVLIVTCPTRTLACRSIPVHTCPRSVVVHCPSVPIVTCPVKSIVTPCVSVPVITCPQHSVVTICPSVVAICPTQVVQGCGQPSLVMQCPTLGPCPSAVDGCPSAPGGCTIDTTVFQGETTVVNPGGQFGGLGNAGYGFGFGG